MRPSSAYARCIAIVLFLLAVSVLAACKTNSTRPAPESTPPPRVNCEAGPSQPLPSIPPLWWMDVWAIEVMGIVEAEYTKRGAEHACLAKLRKEGVIR